MLRFTPALLVILLGLSNSLRADLFLRWNQLGYDPAQPKVLVALSDGDLAGREWFIMRDTRVVLRGVFEASTTGAGEHTPFAYNHLADFSVLAEPGQYEFIAPGAPPAKFRIAEDAYAQIAALPLRHLRIMRSGSLHAQPRMFSHRGDARAIRFEPDGDPANGKWRAAEPAATVDALGGWYDAGDQIKFTLTNAATTYHLLYAYRLHPARFLKQNSRTYLVDVLDEAQHGLEFLMRVHPDRDTFVIQVGNAEDHNQEPRLPEEDKLDGKRPALCALSQVHMGASAAALALGARVFGEIGRPEDAQRYAEMAQRMYARAREPDTVVTAFERDQVNDFYRDPDARDQLAVAAMELFVLTGEDAYLEQAKAYAPPAAREVGWADWNWLANSALAPHDAGARARLEEEVARYTSTALGAAGRPWGIPGRYVWGSLARWIGMANAARLSSDSAESRALFWAMTDYTFGRNNWGVSFFFDENIPNSVRRLYSPTYKLLRRFPTGALSEGPGEKKLHDSLSHYFKIAPDDPFHRFNTDAGVFFDNNTDFMCQEATITAQADILILLVLAARGETAP